jgi:hypothetical protein
MAGPTKKTHLGGWLKRSRKPRIRLHAPVPVAPPAPIEPPSPTLRDFRFKGAVGSQQISAGYEAAYNPGLTQTQRDTRDSMRQIVKQYSDLVGYIQGVTPDIMLLAMRQPFALSQVYVPKDTLELMHSGYLVITTRGATPAVEIGYGRNGIPDYAALQHENLFFHHQAPTRAKYLQSALEETYGQVWGSIQEMLASIVGQGLSTSNIKAKPIVPSGMRVR